MQPGKDGLLIDILKSPAIIQEETPRKVLVVRSLLAASGRGKRRSRLALRHLKRNSDFVREISRHSSSRRGCEDMKMRFHTQFIEELMRRDEDVSFHQSSHGNQEC